MIVCMVACFILPVSISGAKLQNAGPGVEHKVTAPVRVTCSLPAFHVEQSQNQGCSTYKKGTCSTGFALACDCVTRGPAQPLGNVCKNRVKLTTKEHFKCREEGWPYSKTPSLPFRGRVDISDVCISQANACDCH